MQKHEGPRVCGALRESLVSRAVFGTNQPTVAGIIEPWPASANHRLHQPTMALRAFIGRTLIFRVAGFAFTVIISPGLKGLAFS